jgi:RHS repeat-associated protein
MNRYHNLIQYVILKSVVLLLVLCAGTNAKAQITLASGKAAHLWEQPDTTADVLAYPYIERKDSMVFTYSDLQSGYKFMEREGSMEGNYCANRRLRRAKVTVRLDLGPDYRYGKNAFQVTVPFVLTLYGTSTTWFEPAGGISFYNLIINQDKPEAEYTVLYEPFAVSPEHTTADYDQVYFIDASIWGLASTNSAVNKDVRFTIFLYEEYEIDAHRIGGSTDPLVEPVKVTGGSENPVHFAWNIDAACNDTFPGYQLQVLRLYNTDPDKKSDEEVKAVVDWSQALTIEIEKKKTSVNLTLTEGTGYYVWRVRPIGSYYEGGFADARNWGEWSDAPADGDILEYTDPNATPVLTNDALFYYEQFDDDKNWMHNRSFTEGGLAHEGIQYTNTLAQPVQQQSLVKSEGNKLVSQTLYDYSGRPALSSMVVPLEGTAFGYVSAMVQQTGGGNYTAANFDEDGNYREPDAAGGFVATYYSATNTDEQIPDAEGYPFSRVLFEEDGTGRIREAGGVGSVHRLKESSTDRTAKVSYSSVSEQELVKLFGDEAPDDASVVKRLTTDPNKVTSVEYLSKEGQVIATCYEKIPGDELLLDLSDDETVLSTTIADTIRRSVRSGDNIYRAQKRYSFTNPTEVTISYSLTPPTASMNDEGDCVDYCATCEYVVWIRVHNVHDPSDMQEYPIVISPTDCETSTSGTVSQTITLLPGTYIIERYIDSNPVDENNKTAAQRFKDAIAAQVRGSLTSHPTIVALNALLEEGDIEGFYEYLGVTDLDAAQNTEIEIETDCCTLRIPVIAPECARNACRNGTPDFEAYLIDRWGSKYGDGSPNNLNKYFWHYGGADKYPDNTTYPNGHGAFNQMITNMLAEMVEDEPLYNCQRLWECWTSFVDAYELMAYPAGVKDVRFDLLEAFLDCTGRRYTNKTVVAYSSTAGYLTHAYKMVYDNSSTHAEAWTHCTSVIGNWTTWINQPDSSAQWKRFYDCVRTYDYMKSNNNDEDVKNTFESCFEDDMEEMEPEDRFNCAVEQRNRMQGACQQQCESMRWLYIDRIVKEFEESGAGSVQWDVVACLADALIAECQEKCKLDILTREEDGELEVDGIGTEQQWENVQQVYSQVIEIHLPDGDECPDNSYELKQGWSVDYKDLILDHLNQKLVEFKATVGVDGAVWNFKSALQEVAPPDIVSSFSGYEVLVRPDADMIFEVDENCQLWFKRQNNCYSSTMEHPLVAHLNNYLNVFWGYEIPGTGQEYNDVLHGNYDYGSSHYIIQNRDFLIDNLPSDYHTKLATYTNAEFSCINGHIDNQPLSSFIHLLGPIDRTSIDAWRRYYYSPPLLMKYPSTASYLIENFKIFDIGIYFDDWNIIESYWSRGVWNQQDMKSTLNSFYARSCGTTEPAVVKQYLDIRTKEKFDRHIYNYFTTSSYAAPYTTKIGYFGQDEEGYLVYYSYVSYDESGDSLAFDLAHPIVHRICSVRFFGRDSVRLSTDVCSTFVCPDMCIRWVPLPYDPVEIIDELKPALCKPTVLKQIHGALDDAIEQCVTSRVKNAEDIYRSLCLDVSGLNDVFTISYPIEYTHFTLYYYDRAGSLLKTVPPKGIRLNAASRLDVSNHKMVTYYQYNTLGQLVYTKDDDRGERRYAHDDKLRIKMSQNSVQNENDKVSYTKYDELGRVIETGETDYPTGGGSNFYTNSELADIAFPSIGEQRTYFVYGQEIADVSTPVAGIPDQENLRNALSYAYTDDEVYSVYSYDVHGNATWFAQDIPGMQRTNLVEYEYDLLTGLVRQQAYNKESPDRLFHRFVYDNDLRMTQVETSRDGHIWDSDARYSYYQHGPLRRREIGEDSLQGVDYTYTLQGWLKAINHPKSPTVASGMSSGVYIDPGSDGVSSGTNPTVPQDAFGSELFYYHGDFTRGVFTTSEATFLDGTPLYNGMIASHSSQVLTVNDPDLVYQGLTGENYQYDMIGRLRKSQFNTYSSGWQQEDDYLSSYTYDPNGNMRTLKRNANTGMSGIVMDDHTFGYYAPGGIESNRLESVTEGSPLPNAVTEDIDNLGAGNYIYNANGQLVSDQSMVPISNNTNSITWTVSGKVQTVQQELATGLVKNTTYTYDAAGNKVKERSVTVLPGPGGSSEEHIQYYVYDAGGTLLAVYEQDCENFGEEGRAFRAPRAGFAMLEESECDAPVVCKDLIIYGMGREGVIHPDVAIVPPVSDGRIFYREIGDKEYELTDHLGNVRVTLSDIKLSLLTGNVNDPPYNFRVDSLSTGNYYPFGMAHPHRNWRRPSVTNLYRFRYNGMEEDLGGNLFGNTYSTMFRQLDARLGRWWSPDPVVHPWESPYVSMGNNPVSYVDPLGLKEKDPEDGKTEEEYAETGTDWRTLNFMPRVKGDGIMLYEVADYMGLIPEYTSTVSYWDYGGYTFSARERINSDGNRTLVGYVAGKWAVYGRPPALGVAGFRIEYFIQPRAVSISEFMENIDAFQRGADWVYYGSMIQGTDGLHLSPYMLKIHSGDWDGAMYDYWSSQWTTENVIWNLFAAGSAYAHMLPRVPRGARVDLMGGKTGTPGYINYDLQATNGIADDVANFGNHFGTGTVGEMLVNNPMAPFLEQVTPSLQKGARLTIRGQFANKYFRTVWDATDIPGYKVIDRQRGISPAPYFKTDGTPIQGTMNELILEKL